MPALCPNRLTLVLLVERPLAAPPAQRVGLGLLLSETLRSCRVNSVSLSFLWILLVVDGSMYPWSSFEV